MSETRIGWVGTGVMGISMCGHLMAKGYPTTIYSRTKSRAQSLLDKGAVWADTPGEVARRSDIVFTCRAAERRAGGLRSRVGSSTLWGRQHVVDMKTTEPHRAEI